MDQNIVEIKEGTNHVESYVKDSEIVGQNIAEVGEGTNPVENNVRDDVEESETMDQKIVEMNEGKNRMESDGKDVKESEQTKLSQMHISVSDNAAVSNAAFSCDTKCLPSSLSSDAPLSDDLSFVPAQVLSCDFVNNVGVSKEQTSAVIIDVNGQEIMPKSNENFGSQESQKIQSVSSVQHDAVNEIEKSKLASLQDEISDLKGKLKSQEITFKEAESKIRAEILRSVEKLSRERDDLRRAKEDIETKCASNEKELYMEQKIEKDMTKRITVLKKERKALVCKVKDAIITNKKLGANIESQVAKISKLRVENKKLNADFEAKKSEVKETRQKYGVDHGTQQEIAGKLENMMSGFQKLMDMAKEEYELCQKQSMFLQLLPHIPLPEPRRRGGKRECRLRRK